jgi:Na+-transporting NADH:ubiquinone oxidoreductase subunit C
MMIVFVLVIGTILTASLIAVDFYTTPVIEANEQLRTKTSILTALGIPFETEEAEEVFSSRVMEQSSGDTTYYVSKTRDLAFAFEGAGLWGPITGIIALKPDRRTLKAVTIIEQEETPGLGGRIAEPGYLALFEDRPFLPELRSTAPGKGGGPTDIDSITGATMTSDAFVGILNSELDRFLGAVGGK